MPTANEKPWQKQAYQVAHPSITSYGRPVRCAVQPVLIMVRAMLQPGFSIR
jgi:hypothetical protein